MKRKLFFLFDKLQITRNERLAISVLMVLLVSLLLTRTLIGSSSPFNKKYYQKLDKEFQKKTAVLKRKERTILARYQDKASPKIALKSSSPDTVKKGGAAKINPHKNSLIDINTAGFDELQKLPGIGPAYARRIIQYRKKKGPFQTTSDILKIKGIGPGTLHKMEPFISLKSDYTKTDSLAEGPTQTQELEKATRKKNPVNRSLININTAGAQKLQTLPGIGAALSQRIIAFRQKNGPFKTKNALLKIKGIGKKTLAKLVSFIKLRE